MDPKDVEVLKRQLKIGGRMIAPVGVGVQVLLQFDRVGRSTGRVSGLPPPLQAPQTPESTCNIAKHFPTHPRNGTRWAPLYGYPQRRTSGPNEVMMQYAMCLSQTPRPSSGDEGWRVWRREKSFALLLHTHGSFLPICPNNPNN